MDIYRPIFTKHGKFTILRVSCNGREMSKKNSKASKRKSFWNVARKFFKKSNLKKWIFLNHFVIGFSIELKSKY